MGTPRVLSTAKSRKVTSDSDDKNQRKIAVHPQESITIDGGADANNPANIKLINGILASRQFALADTSARLLAYLYQEKARPLTDKDIAIDFFRKDPTSDCFSQDQNSARVALVSVRRRLTEYRAANLSNPIVCALPDAPTSGGYQLTFELAPVTASQCFWKVHQDVVADTSVISGAHLFFFDPITSTILRYYDFNEDAQPKEIRNKLKVAHPELRAVDDFELWRSTYLARGDVIAYEALLHYFHERTGHLIRRVTSREIKEPDIHRCSPILVGRPQTNPLIKAMMESTQAEPFGYRIHEAKGTIKINRITPRERAMLCDYPISKDGVVGPVTHLGKVFGIFTRMPNPSGRGPLTIISCDYHAMVVGRITEILTTEELATSLLIEMKWPPDRQLPRRFEILFLVTLAPGGLEGEGDPALVAWRNLDA